MLQLLKLFVTSNRGTSVSAHFPPNYKNVMKQILMGLAVLPMCLCAVAQTSENAVNADTLSQGVMLEEVEIKGSTMIEKSDRKLLIPTQEQVALSANGVDLLRNMQVPQISVNLTNGEIKTVDSGTLSVRINGREATVDDVKALDPATVKRVAAISGRMSCRDYAALEIILQRRSSTRGGISLPSPAATAFVPASIYGATMKSIS